MEAFEELCGGDTWWPSSSRLVAIVTDVAWVSNGPISSHKYHPLDTCPLHMEPGDNFNMWERPWNEKVLFLFKASLKDTNYWLRIILVLTFQPTHNENTIFHFEQTKHAVKKWNTDENRINAIQHSDCNAMLGTSTGCVRCAGRGGLVSTKISSPRFPGSGAPPVSAQCPASILAPSPNTRPLALDLETKRSEVWGCTITEKAPSPGWKCLLALSNLTIY